MALTSTYPSSQFAESTTRIADSKILGTPVSRARKKFTVANHKIEMALKFKALKCCQMGRLDGVKDGLDEGSWVLPVR